MLHFGFSYMGFIFLLMLLGERIIYFGHGRPVQNRTGRKEPASDIGGPCLIKLRLAYLKKIQYLEFNNVNVICYNENIQEHRAGDKNDRPWITLQVLLCARYRR